MTIDNWYATYEERKRITRAIQRGGALGIRGWVREEDLKSRYPERVIGEMIKEGRIYSPKWGFYALTQPDLVRQIISPAKTEPSKKSKVRK